MLLSLSLILIIGFTLSGILSRFRIPGLIGLIFTGILLGPQGLDLISMDILNISKDLRENALIVILLRVGLTLDLRDLKKVGRPAVLMSFVPATFEILAIFFIAPPLLGISYIEALILGSVLSAVSPAVVVPRMIHLMESGYGRKKRIPQLVLAGASVDDIYVIVLFTAFLGVYAGNQLSAGVFLSVPVSVLSGIALGILAGVVMVSVFRKIHVRDTIKVLIILSVSFLFMSFKISLPPISLFPDFWLSWRWVEPSPKGMRCWLEESSANSPRSGWVQKFFCSCWSVLQWRSKRFQELA